MRRLGYWRSGVQVLATFYVLTAGRLGLKISGTFFPCLTCHFVVGGCGGCLLRFIQYFSVYLATPLALINPNNYGYFTALGVTIVLWIILGNVWRGWFCPFGLIQDLLRALGSILGLGPNRLTPNVRRFLNITRYTLLFGLLGVTSLVEAGYLHPDFVYVFCQICPAGNITPLLVGQTDRLALNVASFVSTLVSGFSLALSGTIFGLSLAAFWPWSQVCPIPVLARIFKKVRLLRLTRDPNLCVGCWRCLKVCPINGALDLQNNRPGDCQDRGRRLPACPAQDRLKLTLAGQVLARSKG
ncbi:MAG: 4Fe-4S binding protein, partial [Deltaproteobacteria bacterium]|nr:4Fe-4S binding protein [Deltaproteobacteria bacterium]